MFGFLKNPSKSRDVSSLQCLFALCGISAISFLWGCSSEEEQTKKTFHSGQVDAQKLNDQILQWCVDILGRPEQLIMPQNMQQLSDLQSGEALRSIIDRLNQWMRYRTDDSGWEKASLARDLPEEFSAITQEVPLEILRFQREDGAFLTEAIWLRQIVQQTLLDQVNPLAKAELLFDWTVRNIQLPRANQTKEESRLLPHRLLHVLVLGQGTVEDRAWCFLRLCRQAELDAMILALPEAEKDSTKSWLTAVLIDGEYYLFDPGLGLPIPGPDGEGVATLSQVQADAGLLRRLDLDAENPYLLSAEDLSKMVVRIEASPEALSRRMEIFEERITGAKPLFLSARSEEIQEKILATDKTRKVAIWAYPWQCVLAMAHADAESQAIMERQFQPFFQPSNSLLIGRLRHLAGVYPGEDGAKQLYLGCRMSTQMLENVRSQLGGNIPPQIKKELEKQFPQGMTVDKLMTEQMMEVAEEMDQSASYWLGVMAFEEENYSASLDLLKTRTLDAYPGGIRTAGARYNIGRVYEHLERYPEAIEIYRADRSQQRHGSLLRAKWLEEKGATSPSPKPE